MQIEVKSVGGGVDISTSSEYEDPASHKENPLTTPLHVPAPVIGREEEFRIFHNAYHRITSGRTTIFPSVKSEIVLVKGPSGIGKSFFVNRCMRQLFSNEEGRTRESRRRDTTFFISGKCNQIIWSHPLACITDALSMLCSQMLDMKKDQLDLFLRCIVRMVGDEGLCLICSLVPRLQSIFDISYYPPDEMPQKEREVQMNTAFRRLFRAITAHANLVMYLDDLQWVDETSLDLMKAIISDEKIEGFLLVCSYRDLEIESNVKEKYQLDDYFHFLAKDEKKWVTQIELGALSVENVASIVTQELNVSENKATLLSKFIHSHTQGNACFVSRLISYLQYMDFIRSLPDGSGWDWEDEEIQEWNIPSTLEEMLVDELVNIPEVIRDFLTTAAAIGFYFDDFSMNLVTQQCRSMSSLAGIPSFRVRSSLISCMEIARDRHYITKSGSSGHSFSHDSLWKASYNLLSEESRSSLHLKIGRILLQQARPRKSLILRGSNQNLSARQLTMNAYEMSGFVDRQLCLIVDQLNRGRHLISSPSERSDLISLNIRAAKLLSTNYNSWKLAFENLQAGIDLLTEDEWELNYEKCLQIYSDMAECAMSIGDVKTMEKCIDMVLKHGQSIDDTYDVYRTSIMSLKVREINDKAMELTKFVLNQLGVRTNWDNMSKVDKIVFFREVKWKLRNHTKETLLGLPILKDERIKKAIKLLYELTPHAYGSDLLPVILCLILKYTLKHGVCGEAANTFLCLASIQIWPQKTAMLSEAGLELIEKLDAKMLKPASMQVFYANIRPWVAPLDEVVGPLLQGHKLASQMGDLEHGCYLGILHISFLYFSGEQLSEVEKKMKLFQNWMQDYKINSGHTLFSFLPFLQSVRCLQGRTKCPFLLDGDVMNLQSVLPHGKNSTMVACYLALCRLELFCLFHKYNEASEILKSTPDVRKVRKSQISGVRFTFYECLASINLARITGEKKWKRRANYSFKVLMKWEKNGNVNCSHMIPFLEAEMEIMRGNVFKAKKLFHQAIKSTDFGTFIQDKALVFEKAGMFFKSMNDRELSSSCLSQARDLYFSWGAKAKANCIAQKGSC